MAQGSRFSHRLSTFFRHGLLQAAAALMAWFFVAPVLEPKVWAFLQGGFAFLLAGLLRLSIIHSCMHMVFVPLGILAWSANLSSSFYFVVLFSLLALQYNAWAERVPLYRSSLAAIDMLAQRLPLGARLLEAGCGDARLALYLISRRPDIAIVALESAFGSCALAWLRWCLQGRPRQVKVRLSNIWKEDWSAYDAIYVFLSPDPMVRIANKFDCEARDGALLISNSFGIPGRVPDETLPLRGSLQQELLIWCHSNAAR